MKKKKQSELWKRKDMFLILLLLAFGGGIILSTYVTKGEHNRVQVRVDNKIVKDISLEENIEFTVEGIGGSNKIKIENGSVWLVDADCPDRLCVKTGKIKMVGQSIICLPHRLVVEIKEAEDGE